jgi:3-hydroxy-9,10-secoandrosta-1,3,5(10)-triene-9,17-dione monooxygenase
MATIAEPATQAAGPVLTLDSALDAARALVPVLRERAALAEELRRIPDETVRDLRASGLLRVLQPRRVGGSEVEWVGLIDISAELGRGCGSSAWNWANWAAHHWMLALWPRQCQDEIWGEDADVLIASSLAFPAGRASRVDGGYLVSGRWPFSSGVDGSRWDMVGAIVQGDPPEYRLFCIPASDYRVVDNWHVMGLRGTGSKDVEAFDLFVPEHRALAVDATKGGTTHPGAASNPGALYRVPFIAGLAHMLVGVPLGIAQGAYDSLVEGLRGRASRYSGKNLSDLSAVQMRVAEAGASLDAARALLRRDCFEAQEIAERGEVPDLLVKAAWRRNGAFAAQLAQRAMDVVFKASGGTALFDTNPMQRSFRDFNAANAHISMIWDPQATTYGRVALGLPSDNPTL